MRVSRSGLSTPHTPHLLLQALMRQSRSLSTARLCLRSAWHSLEQSPYHRLLATWDSSECSCSCPFTPDSPVFSPTTLLCWNLCSWSAPSNVVSVANPYIAYTAPPTGQNTIGSVRLGATLSIPAISFTAASMLSIVDSDTVTISSNASFTVANLFKVQGGLYLVTSTLNGGSIKGSVQSVGTF